MRTLIELRSSAVILRQQGLTYSEISRQLGVSKSSLSLWLRGVPLSLEKLRSLAGGRRERIQRGALIRKERLEKIRIDLINNSAKEIGNLSDRELWLVGIALYWAEGSKQREKSRSQSLVFSNTDVDMIRLFYIWLTRILKIEEENLIFEIYINQVLTGEKRRIREFWSSKLNIPLQKFDRIYLKRNSISRPYSKNKYNGLLRIYVKRSTLLNRKISGWQRGIADCGIV